jgi:PEP-CTERM motif
MNKLTKVLLASTCLTALNSTSALATYIEVEPNDTLATADPVPIAETEVTGIAEGQFTDYYRWTGLDPNGTFSASITRVDGGGGGFFFSSLFSALSSAGAGINSANLGCCFGGSNPQQATVMGDIPDNGLLVLSTSGSLSEGGPVNYHITLTAPLAQAVPEPGTLGLLASGLLGLAGLGALKRKQLTDNPASDGGSDLTTAA